MFWRTGAAVHCHALTRQSEFDDDSPPTRFLALQRGRRAL